MTKPPFPRRGRVALRPPPDALFFSHLRWDFVFQRPQHIVSRWAKDHRAYFWEEPFFDASEPRVDVHERGEVRVVVPHLVQGDPVPEVTLTRLLDRFVASEGIVDPLVWYWTPMMRPFSRHLAASVVVWDCMDELGAFAFAPPELVQREQEMLRDAHLVFTGGHQLYLHKRDRHPDVRAFPSSVDVAHFGKARENPADPADQAHLPRPRIGWFGVIDERTDLEIIDRVAADRPDWQLVLVGPVVKIPAESLPRRQNIHWLGMKSYADLPSYVAHWDVAMLPFAHNESTRFISPTKTPEYLAAGRPVVSTSITDVVRPYGEQGLVWIADGPADFRDAIEQALCDDCEERRKAADELLASMSWDETVARMRDAVAEKMQVLVAS